MCLELKLNDKMRSVFNDTSLNEKFLKEGYLIIPFTTESEIDDIKEKLLQLKPSDNFEGNQDTLIGKQSFHITFFDSNQKYKKEMFDFLRLLFKRIAEKTLLDYKCAQANVFLKPANAGSVYPHQNLTITDETKYRTLSFWLPLQDTTEENGTVCLIPGTQNFFLKYRNTHVYWPYTKFLASETGLKYFTTVNVKKGELLIIDDRIVHYTPINKTKNSRWVLHSLWAPTEAPLNFYDPEKNKIKKYLVADDFWQYHEPGVLLDKIEPDQILENDEVLYSEKETIQLLENLKNQ